MNTDAATVTQMVNIYSVPAHDTVSFICSAGLSCQLGKGQAPGRFHGPHGPSLCCRPRAYLAKSHWLSSRNSPSCDFRVMSSRVS